MRKVIISLSGIAILVIGFLSFKGLANSKDEPEKKSDKTVKLVYVEAVKNTNIPISITTSGSLLARDRMTLFSEVQGVFMPSSKRFKAGERYRKGEALIRINSEEFKANVIAQRSGFKSLITSILPDLKFDYPESFDAWNTFLKTIEIEKSLPELPKAKSEKEESYITGKSINVTYYNIKNLEARLRKYTITAPYSGVLIESNINPGALVSPGQKLGEFINPNVFELELNVNANLQDFLSVGKNVELNNIENTEKYSGVVSRINQKIDRASQTIKIFVQVKSNALKEGEYLEAHINANSAENAIEIPRSLLVNNEAIYIVKDSVLQLTPVNVFYSSLNKVVVRGLDDGVQYLSKPIAGGYEGMKVKVMTD